MLRYRVVVDRGCSELPASLRLRHHRRMQWWRLRAAVNWVNLSTPLGLAVAKLGRAQLESCGSGLHLAAGCALRLPRAGAFTIGSVIITSHHRAWLLQRPRLLAHEARHAWQYASCAGLPFLPLYAAGAAWSWWRTADPAARNPFELLAGLADGGYSPRPTVRRLAHIAAAGRAVNLRARQARR